MIMKYTPMTDEQLEEQIDNALDDAYDKIANLDLPIDLLAKLQDVANDWDGWTELLNQRDYDLYESAVEDYYEDTRGL